MYYIHENDKPKFWHEKLNIITLNNDRIILPIKGEEELKNKKIEQLAQKTKKILEKTNCNKIVVSKKIKKQEIFMNYLYSYNFNIIDGKWLFEVLVIKVLDYIMQQMDMKKERTQIAFVVNDLSIIMLENLRQIVKRL